MMLLKIPEIFEKKINVATILIHFWSLMKSSGILNIMIIFGTFWGHFWSFWNILGHFLILTYLWHFKFQESFEVSVGFSAFLNSIPLFFTFQIAKYFETFLWFFRVFVILVIFGHICSFLDISHFYPFFDISNFEVFLNIFLSLLRVLVIFFDISGSFVAIFGHFCLFLDIFYF